GRGAGAVRCRPRRARAPPLTAPPRGPRGRRHEHRQDPRAHHTAPDERTSATHGRLHCGILPPVSRRHHGDGTRPDRASSRGAVAASGSAPGPPLDARPSPGGYRPSLWRLSMIGPRQRTVKAVEVGANIAAADDPARPLLPAAGRPWDGGAAPRWTRG